MELTQVPNKCGAVIQIMLNILGKKHHNTQSIYGEQNNLNGNMVILRVLINTNVQFLTTDF